MTSQESESNHSQQTRKALSWNFLDKFLFQLLSFVFGVILARLLLPEAFGLIAMLHIIIALSTTLTEAGLGQALIKSQSAGNHSYNSVFYFNICLSLLLYLIIYFTAPAIARFYEIPSLIQLNRLLGLSIIFSSFGMVQNTILIKNLDYRRLFIVSSISLIVSGIASVIAAFNGMGVYSLVVRIVLLSLCKSILLWIINPWKPAFTFSFDELKSLLKFSIGIMGSNITNVIFDNLYYVVIGKLFSTANLGFYRKAKSLQDTPVIFVNQLVTALYPAMAKIQGQHNILARFINDYVRRIAFISFPLVIIVFFSAPEFVEILLTDKWMPSVKLLRIFCVGGFFYSLTFYFHRILFIKNKTSLFFKAEMLKKVAFVLAIVLGYQFGLEGMAFGYSLVNVVFFIVYSFLSIKISELKTVDFLKAFLPPLLISLTALLPVYLYKNNNQHAVLVVFMLSIGIYLLSYLILAFFIDKKSFSESKEAIRWLLKRKKTKVS